MALARYSTLVIPIKLLGTTSDSGEIAILVGSGAPDGDASPQSDASKGSLYIRSDATDDQPCLYLKVDSDSADDDWAAVMINNDESAKTLEANLTLDADARVWFRDSSTGSIYSSAASVINFLLESGIALRLGGSANYTTIADDGEINLVGTAKVTRAIPLALDAGHGTATVEEFKGAPSINLDADTEEWFLSFEAPNDWDAASDLTLVFMVANEIAEDDGDDVSFTIQARGYADGEAVSDAGQTVSATLNLTGGDEAIDVVNRVTGAIDYDDGTYPIAAGDTVVCKCAVNLGGGGECTGPLHIIAQWVEYTANKLGTAT